MLGKLFKYEFKATRRIMLPLLAATAVIYALIMLLSEFQLRKLMVNIFDGGAAGLTLAAFSGVTLILNVVVTVAAVCMNLFLVFSRFRGGILGNEGYLTNVLPVSAGSKLLSRLVTSVFWVVATIAVIDITTDIMSRLLENVSYSAFLYESGEYSANPVLDNLASWGIFAAGVCLAYSVLYAAMAIGYSKNSHRLLISIAVGVGLWILKLAADFVLVLVFARIFGESYYLAGLFDLKIDGTNRAMFDGAQTALYLVESAALFFVTRHFIGKKLNLQ